MAGAETQSKQKNVLGQPMETCGCEPMTGFYRDGCCHTGPDDQGMHTVCCLVNDEFLKASARLGNDLITPHPEWDFPGLKPGDKWCLCVTRWQEALESGKAPLVDLAATHSSAVEFVTLEELRAHAVKD